MSISQTLNGFKPWIGTGIRLNDRRKGKAMYFSLFSATSIPSNSFPSLNFLSSKLRGFFFKFKYYF